MKFTLEQVEELAAQYDFLTEDQCLVCVVSSEGYKIGVADRDVKGYTDTHHTIAHDRYDDAKNVVKNANILLGKDLIDCMRLVASTF